MFVVYLGGWRHLQRGHTHPSENLKHSWIDQFNPSNFRSFDSHGSQVTVDIVLAREGRRSKHIMKRLEVSSCASLTDFFLAGFTSPAVTALCKPLRPGWRSPCTWMSRGKSYLRHSPTNPCTKTKPTCPCTWRHTSGRCFPYLSQEMWCTSWNTCPSPGGVQTIQWFSHESRPIWSWHVTISLALLSCPTLTKSSNFFS